VGALMLECATDTETVETAETDDDDVAMLAISQTKKHF
jgi:hypothetical protein